MSDSRLSKRYAKALFGLGREDDDFGRYGQELVEFTDFKRRLGDVEAADVLSRHDTLFRRCLDQSGGVEQTHTGDGFFATFKVPSEAVQCAMAFQQGLAAIQTPAPLEARVGIHMGEIVQMAGAKTEEGQDQLVGLAIDTASRIMGLALPGQILLTRPTFDSARQQVQLAVDGDSVEWLDHGSYLFRGIDDAVVVCEVGIHGTSPLSPPQDSEKARRVMTTFETTTEPACPRCKGSGKDRPLRRLLAAAFCWGLWFLLSWCEEKATSGAGARYFGADAGVFTILPYLRYVPGIIFYYELARMLWAFLGGRCPSCKGTCKVAATVTAS